MLLLGARVRVRRGLIGGEDDSLLRRHPIPTRKRLENVLFDLAVTGSVKKSGSAETTAREGYCLERRPTKAGLWCAIGCDSPALFYYRFHYATGVEHCSWGVATLDIVRFEHPHMTYPEMY